MTSCIIHFCRQANRMFMQVFVACGYYPHHSGWHKQRRAAVHVRCVAEREAVWGIPVQGPTAQKTATPITWVFLHLK